MRRVYHEVKNFLVRGVNIDQIHPGRRHHYIARSEISHPDHTLQHGSGLGADDLVVLGVRKSFVEIRLGIRARVKEFNKPL